MSLNEMFTWCGAVLRVTQVKQSDLMIERTTLPIAC